jgi:hypothetical protein
MSLVHVHRLNARTPRLMTYTILLAAAVMALGAQRAQALPVIPGTVGFGVETPAGRGGTVYRVTNLNADGAGSLKACIDGTTARVCIFEVSGTIKLTQDLQVRWDKLTIAGQTAPSPGIMIRGGALVIHASDVLVQHIRLRVGDDKVGPAFDNRDSLKLEGSDTHPVKRVVIDHCSVSWSVDEVASVWGAHDEISFLNNIFSEPLNNSFHPDYDGTGHIDHGFGVLLGSSPSGGRVSMFGNLMAHETERNPLTRARELVFVNNMIYDRQGRDFDAQSEKGRTTKTSVVGNTFVKGPSYDAPTKPVYIRTNGDYTLYAGSKIYVSQNHADSGDSNSQMIVFTGGDVISGLLSTTTAPVWISGLKVASASSGSVYYSVLKNVGARPADRDSVDKRVIDHVKTRSGGIINCVANDGSSRCSRNAGGWPYLAPHTRKLTLPSNPGSVASNGYTNLENWLHSMADTAQGTTSPQSAAAPASMSVN